MLPIASGGKVCLCARPRPIVIFVTIQHHLYPVYTMKQTSSKRRANIEQVSSKDEAIRAHVVYVYTEYVCMMSA